MYTLLPERPVAILVTILLAALALPAQAEHGPKPRSVTVSGEAERRVAPDMATLDMAVVIDGIDAGRAREEADATVARARSLLRARGIEDGDVDSSALEIMPQYRWTEDTREQRLVGYRVTRRIEVRLVDLSLLGDLLVALSDAGINEVRPPRPGLKDPESVYREVLAEAADNARRRAVVLAETLGEELGEVLSIDTQDTQRPIPVAREAMMMAADAKSGGGSSYQSGDLTFRVTLLARFGLR